MNLQAQVTQPANKMSVNETGVTMDTASGSDDQAMAATSRLLAGETEGQETKMECWDFIHIDYKLSKQHDKVIQATTRLSDASQYWTWRATMERALYSAGLPAAEQVAAVHERLIHDVRDKLHKKFPQMHRCWKLTTLPQFMAMVRVAVAALTKAQNAELLLKTHKQKEGENIAAFVRRTIRLMADAKLVGSEANRFEADVQRDRFWRTFQAGVRSPAMKQMVRWWAAELTWSAEEIERRASVCESVMATENGEARCMAPPPQLKPVGTKKTVETMEIDVLRANQSRARPAQPPKEYEEKENQPFSGKCYLCQKTGHRK